MKCYGTEKNNGKNTHYMESSFIQHHQPYLFTHMSKLSPKRVSTRSSTLFLQILIFYAYILQFYTVNSFTTTFIPRIQTHHGSKVITPEKLENIQSIRKTGKEMIPNRNHRRNFSPCYSHNSENESIKAKSDAIDNERRNHVKNTLTIDKMRSYAVSIGRLRKADFKDHSKNSKTIVDTKVSHTSKKKKKLLHNTNAPISTARSFVRSLNDETILLYKGLNIFIEGGSSAAINFFNDQDIKTISLTHDKTSELKDAMNYSAIQAIRAFADTGDFVWILKTLDAFVDYATIFAVTRSLLHKGSDDGDDDFNSSLLQPRIFGEAITGLVKGTKANTSKLRYVWNMLLSVTNCKNHENEDFLKKKLTDGGIKENSLEDIIREINVSKSNAYILDSYPGAFELNSMINALSRHNKLRAALNLYKDVSKPPATNETKEQLSVTGIMTCPIEIDSYTISSIFKILAESIPEPDPSITDDLYISDSSLPGGKTQRRKRGKDKLQRDSPCWQWREAMEILDELSISNQKKHFSAVDGRNGRIPLNYYVYSALLKVNEKASELFQSNKNRHNGAQVAMEILQHMRVSLFLDFFNSMILCFADIFFNIFRECSS